MNDASSPSSSPSAASPSAASPSAASGLVAVAGRRQDGLVSREQALASGVTPKAIAMKLASGRWSAVLPGIYQIDDRPMTPLAWARAATLRWGPVVASHSSAAAILGLPVVSTPAGWAELGMPADPPLPPLTLTVPADRRLRCGSEIRTIRTRRPPAPTVNRFGVRLTDVRRTVTDLLVDAPLVMAMAAADAACHTYALSVDDLDQQLCELPRRRGIDQARRRLGLIEPATESPLETLVRLLLVVSALPRPQAQVEIAAPDGRFLGRVDFLLPGRIIVEADGRRHHESWDAAVADRQRQNQLVDAGFRVLRTTWRDVTAHPAALVALVRSALGADATAL